MRLALALALASFVGAPAAAQDTRSTEVTIYEFMDDLVTGGRYRPEGENLTVLRRSARRTLIRARAHFVPEMLRSVERL